MQKQQVDEFKYKSILFYTFTLTVIFGVIGVIFFRDIYFIIGTLSLLYALLKYTQMAFIMVYANFKYDEAMKSFKKRQQQNHSCLKEVTHVFVLPNFNEDEGLLSESIMNLAQHSRAKDYCLFLAMEKHQIDVDLKAKKLVEEYKRYFRLMHYTVHELQEGEAKAKSTNINWCCRHMNTKLIQNFVNMDTVIVTIMDSDSLIPQAYIDQVQKNIQQQNQKRHLTIFQPPQIFARNQKQAAFFVRIMDSLMSFMQVSNLYSMFGYTMGVSNYSLSYRLLQRIDFWDTCVYSKGQDIRITSKCLWKTDGESRTCPIYIPINQLNLVTHQGYIADFKARLLQAKRHGQDQVEVSYNIVNMARSKASLIQKVHAFFTVLQVYIMSITIPVPGLIMVFQDIIPILPKSHYDDGSSFVIFNNLNVLIMTIGFILYEIFKRKACKHLYNVEPMGVAYCCQIPILQIPMVLTFGFYPMVSASYSLLRERITFTVTPKGKIEKKSSLETETIFQSQEIQENKLFDAPVEELPAAAA